MTGVLGPRKGRREERRRQSHESKEQGHRQNTTSKRERENSGRGATNRKSWESERGEEWRTLSRKNDLLDAAGRNMSWEEGRRRGAHQMDTHARYTKQSFHSGEQGETLGVDDRESTEY